MQAAEHTGQLHGTVRTTSGINVRGARITAIDQHGNEFARRESDEDGHYQLGRLGFGLQHLIVVALDCEPAIVPVALHLSHPSARRDVVLIDWSDPPGNLTVGGFDPARALSEAGMLGSHGNHVLRIEGAAGSGSSTPV